MVNNGIRVERAGIIDLSILDELIGADAREKYIDKNGVTRYRKLKKYRVINGVNVKLSSQRYPVFQKSLKCSKCGIEGKYFAIEKTHGDLAENFHLNLYAINENGDEVLMTKDHLVPKSKGGKNAQYNYRTMCVVCNNEKGNKYIDEVELTPEQQQNWLRTQILNHNNGDFENVPLDWIKDENLPKTNVDILNKTYNHKK